MNLTNEQIGQRIKTVRAEKMLHRLSLRSFLGKACAPYKATKVAKAGFSLTPYTALQTFWG